MNTGFSGGNTKVEIQIFNKSIVKLGEPGSNSLVDWVFDDGIAIFFKDHSIGYK